MLPGFITWLKGDRFRGTIVCWFCRSICFFVRTVAFSLVLDLKASRPWIHLTFVVIFVCNIYLQFDVTTDKGLAAFNGFMGSKSYVEGWTFSPADSDVFAKFEGKIPDAAKYPHAYRWYIHIAALSGMRGLVMMAPSAVAAAAPAPAAAAAPAPAAKAKKAAAAEDDDDFDVFGDDEEEKEEKPKESRAEMLARLKKEAEERTALKEAKQRTLVAIEIKPWDVEQDLMALWKKITENVKQDGLKWGESCVSEREPIASNENKISWPKVGTQLFLLS
jgi:elongation factor 1-beta